MNGTSNEDESAATAAAESEAEATAPDAKRSKTTSFLNVNDDDDDDNAIVASDLLQRRPAIQDAYRHATPYPHAHIHNVFRPSFLINVKNEIKSQTKVNFKESDLFRVYQSIDLANLVEGTEWASTLPNVMKLRALLYAQEWRSFIETLAGLPPGTLTSQIDCACNCHAPGCHLLCHDDGIGTRKISYIIYLTEPEWNPSEGGALELYGPQLDNGGDKNLLSSPIPVARAWPDFNSMAFFVVDPGKSFHAVQEVLGNRPRLSLQGWYHAKDPPSNIDQATLQQLKKSKQQQQPPPQQNKFDTNGDKVQEETKEEPLTEKDLEYLKKYIKLEYLTEASMVEVQQKFESDSSVQLRDFLLPKWVPTLEPHDSNFNYDEAYYQSGVSAEWQLKGPAHKQRFLQYDASTQNANDAAVVGSLLRHVRQQVFESSSFGRYLNRITNLGIPTVRSEDSHIRRFRPGLDYTVAHYGLLVHQAVLDATMCFVCDDNDDDRQVWESGDVGGFECYIEADDDDQDDNNAQNENDDGSGNGNGGAKLLPSSSSSGPADEYNEDDDTELLSVSASNNTLSLVYRDPGTMRFVKYLGSSAPSSRYDISMEYDVPPGTDDEDGGDDGNEADDGDEKEKEDAVEEE